MEVEFDFFFFFAYEPTLPLLGSGGRSAGGPAAFPSGLKKPPSTNSDPVITSLIWGRWEKLELCVYINFATAAYFET